MSFLPMVVCISCNYPVNDPRISYQCITLLIISLEYYCMHWLADIHRATHILCITLAVEALSIQISIDDATCSANDDCCTGICNGVLVYHRLVANILLKTQ
jgi:hypothetical protein